jgi:hypothetical protein
LFVCLFVCLFVPKIWFWIYFQYWGLVSSLPPVLDLLNTD